MTDHDTEESPLFVKYGKPVKFPRNEHVDIHVRSVLIGDGRYIDIREFIKNGEVYGHGVLIPSLQAADLQIAITKVRGS